MCNLYASEKSAAEIADHFRAQIPLSFNAGGGRLSGRGGGGGAGGRRHAPLAGRDPGLSAGAEEREGRQADQAEAANDIADPAGLMWRFGAG